MVKITHMWRRWDTTQNFFLAFTDVLEKQIFIKNLFSMLQEKKLGDIIILHLCTKNLNDMIYSFWDKECDRLKMVILGHFQPFNPHKNKKKSKLKKKKEKNCWRYLHFPPVYQKSRSWCTVSMIWSTTDRIFFHSGPFFTLLPYNNQENKNFEKMKKTLGDIIILHMRYGSWDMECHGQNFSHRTIFWLTKKIKFWKNEKKKNIWRYFAQVFQKSYVLDCSWDTTCDRYNFYF